MAGNDLDNLAPRFGFAFSPFEDRGIVIRGGYGSFYDRPTGGFINVLERHSERRANQAEPDRELEALESNFIDPNLKIPYFEVVDDEFQQTPKPTCDVFDDFEDRTIASDLRAPILEFDEDEGVNAITSDSSSNYHALQASLQRRYQAGLSYKVNYTWSKAIDYFSDEGLFQA